MSIKNYNDIITIQDATTGEIIVNLPIKNISYATIEAIVSDLVMGDTEDKHGFIIKWGYKATSL